VARADELRRAAGLTPLVELDRVSRFDPGIHLRPTNNWPLTFLASLLDAERIADDHEVVAVVASSTGWYTALAASGVLELDDALRVVTTLAIAAEAPLPDGRRAAELVYPLTDEAWHPLPERREVIDALVAASDGAVTPALELGSHVVLAGTEPDVEAAAGGLPVVEVGPRSFPLRLPGDGWHSALRGPAVSGAGAALEEISAARPNVALVDGRGRRQTPWSADPSEMLRDAITAQPVSTYDFATSLRVALREYAPDVVLLPGPGASIGAACAQVVVAEGYRGLRSRGEFEQAQAGTTPILLSMRR
jgi:hypothetical protein